MEREVAIRSKDVFVSLCWLLSGRSFDSILELFLLLPLVLFLLLWWLLRALLMTMVHNIGKIGTLS